MDLTAEFVRANAAYAERLAYAENNRKKEIWSNGPFFHTEPYSFERFGFSQGKILKQRPAATKNKYCYWLDEHDIILAVREGIDMPDKFYEEFFFQEEGISKSYRYSYSTSIGVINVKICSLHDNYLNEVFMLGRKGKKHEIYHYEDGVLQNIRVEQWENGEQGTSYNAVFMHEEGKMREIIYEFDNGYKEVRYKAK